MASSNPIDDVSIAATEGASVVAANIATQPTNAAISIVPIMTFVKPFPDISKIEIFMLDVCPKSQS